MKRAKPIQQGDQLPLWDLEALPIPAETEERTVIDQGVRLHNHMELHYASGEREIVCCSAPGPKTYRHDCLYAGFVGLPMKPEACFICNSTKTVNF